MCGSWLLESSWEMGSECHGCGGFSIGRPQWQTAQICDYPEVLESYTFIEQTVWYMNFTSVK